MTWLTPCNLNNYLNKISFKWDNFWAHLRCWKPSVGEWGKKILTNAWAQLKRRLFRYEAHADDCQQSERPTWGTQRWFLESQRSCEPAISRWQTWDQLNRIPIAQTLFKRFVVLNHKAYWDRTAARRKQPTTLQISVGLANWAAGLTWAGMALPSFTRVVGGGLSIGHLIWGFLSAWPKKSW